MAIFRKPRRDPGADGLPTGSGDPVAGRTDPAEPAPAGAATDDRVAGAPTPGPPADGGQPPGELAGELAELVEEMERRPAGEGPSDELDPRHDRGRRRATALVGSVTGLLGRGGLAAARGAGHGSRALADRLLVAAPRIPIRNLATLRAQHPHQADREQLADLLVLGACRASGALGASVGAAAMLPVPPAMPVEIAAETLAVAAVEIKLIAELHEVYGMRASGNVSQRAGAYVSAWANRRGVDGTALVKPAGLAALAVGSEVRQRVRKRLTRSTLRRLPSLTPLLVGAVIGAQINRRDTRRLAHAVRADLRGRQGGDRAYWTAAAPAPVQDGGRGRPKR